MSKQNSELIVTKKPEIVTSMLIRRPVNEVFEAIVNPEITTKFWFTHSTGRLKPDAEVEWQWEMYDATSVTRVKTFEQDKLLVLESKDDESTITTTWKFDDRQEGTATYLTITESGYEGKDGDDVVAKMLGSMGGYTETLAALKALLEHNIVLTLVADRWPDGLLQDSIS